jgi:predicted small secreted protein
MIRKSALAFLIAATTLLAACNTMAGIGRDVKSVGDTVEDAAK